ncbi:MAG: hypothetical protein MJA84_06150 [Firmicutes bacterium]|nr:hypothetical protein [Bacillota bacterium]
MRLILFVMVLCYAIVFWPFGFLLADVLFPWGGVMESHLKPIYLGIVFLSGLMVGCTVYIAELIKELKNKN